MVIYFDGNSLSQSRGGVAAYPTLIDLRAIPSANVSVGGATTVEQDARAVTAVDADQRPGPRWVVCWEGTNDLYFGATAKQALEHLSAYCAHRHAAGFKVLLLSLLPRSDVGRPVTHEANRQIVNQALRETWALMAEGFVDLAADRCMGHTGQEYDERFYLTDRVHLAAAGAFTVAGAVSAALAQQGVFA